MLKESKRVIILIIAGFFLILGVVGLVLPFLQGFLFLAVGMTLLFFVFPTLRERSHHHTSKFPTFHNLILKMESYIERIIGKV